MKTTIAIASFLIFLLAPAYAVAHSPLLIVEVQIAGEKIDNDFIRIYNSSEVDLDIGGYRLRKRASTGSESSIRVFPQESKILAKNYFLWASSKEDYADLIGADEKSTATLAKNNSIALLTPEGEIIDALAWGESKNPFVKDLPFPENPAANQRLERKKINGAYQDTNNNSRDFYLNPASEPAPISEAEIPSGEPPVQSEAQPEVQAEAEEKSIEKEEKEAKETEPEINLLFPQDNPVNKEIEAFFSVSNLKSAAYDVKVSIEKEGVLSDIYDEKQNKWRSSHYYINHLFSGSSFERTFKLKMREENLNFQGEADILVRVRESGKSGYLEHREKINITEPESRTGDGPLPTFVKDLRANSRQTPELPVPFHVSLIASFLAILSGATTLILKKRLK